MKVISVIGYTKSGKTTTIENIIKELVARGYSVGTVKEIHYEQFAIDTIDSNTYRHKSAGAKIATALGFEETDILIPRKLPIRELLTHYTQEWIVLEGVRGLNVPNINTLSTLEKYEGNEFTIALSGVISNTHSEYNNIPCINATTDIKKLVDLIERTTPPLMPDMKPECCSDCGTTCYDFTSKVIHETQSIDKCSVINATIQLEIDGTLIPIVPFVQKILKNTILGVVKELDGYNENGKITIKL